MKSQHKIIVIILSFFAMGIYAQKSITNISKQKEGKWEWFYDNEQLGELGFHKKGKREGEWKWYFKNGGLKTIGYYKNDEPAGIRKWYYSTGKLYCTGQYSNGKREGEWKWYEEINSDSLRVVVNFNKGKVKNYKFIGGKGKVIFENKGNSFTKLTFNENYSYLGVFGLRIEHENGNILVFDDNAYIGNYKKGKPEGEWTTYFMDAAIYQIDNYKKGKLHGSFKQFSREGKLLFIQNYKRGEKQGLYKGYYENGLISSKGRFKKGKQVGKWKLYYENGEIKNIVKYSNGKLNGKHISYHKNGKVMNTAKYSNGKLEGEYISYHENGKLKEIKPYVNNLIHGEWKEYNKEGILIERTRIERQDFTKLHKTYFYANGQIKNIGYTNNGINKYGVWKRYYENGQLEEITNYKEGKEDGRWEKYYENGQIKTEGQYVEGDRDGKFIWYKKDGKIKNATEYKHDSPFIMGEWRYFANGQLQSVELYQRDSLVEWKYYYKNGQLKELRQYHKKRIRTGEWKYYYKSGELRRITHYNNGIPEGEFKLYHKNGQLYKTQVWRHYKKLIEIIACFDEKGNVLDKGTLKNGTGIVYEYNAKGELLNSIEYVKGSPVNNSSIDKVWLDSGKLNSLAWKAYKQENNKEKLSIALKWIKRSIDLEENYYNTDTYAALLYKIGRYEEALSVAKKAIDIAMKSGSKSAPQATKKLIEKIKIKRNKK